MKVLKFGGTSVGSARRMKNIVSIISGGEPKIVVLSAMAGTTNSLVDITPVSYTHLVSASIHTMKRKGTR